MNRRAFGAITACALILGLALPASVGAAKPASSRLHALDASKVDTSLLFGLHPNRLEKVIVELSANPVALYQHDALTKGFKLGKSQKAAIRAQIKASQDKLMPQLHGLGAKVLGQYQDAYNGIKVQVAAGKLANLAALPGVIAVHKVQTYTRENVFGVPYIGAPTAWGTYGETGAGVKIGIIDTGIDYTHANFGGPGTPADYNAAFAADTAPANPAWFGPSAPKVKGGYDFVGDAYAAGVSSPVPDPNPLDCAAHGSHVAGTAAGFGVLSNGTTYTGAYNATTVSGNSWTIGPGVAPQADLYAYRVFGCSGSTDVVIDAINQAVADGMDVINMSLGSPFGDATSPDAVASNNASLAGTVVVASAGNSGPNPEITGSPASADRALSVAALDASQIEVGQIQDLAGQPYGQFDTTVNTLPVTGTLNDRLNGSNLRNGCAASDFTGLGAGDIAIVTRGTCTFATKGTNAQNAGASALIVVNTVNGTLPPGGVGGLSIPVFIFGHEFSATLIAANGTSHTIIDTFVQSPTYQQITSFSSGGPREYDNAVKPEIAAPGNNIVSTEMGSGNKGVAFSGTSMAAPHTSGAAALVIQAHPSWSAEAVKAALIDTANATSSIPGGINPYNLRIAGNGVVAAAKAVSTIAYATTSGGTDTLSFGYEPHNGAYSETLPLTIWNTSGSALTYDLSNAANASVAGLSVSAAPNPIKVPAHGSKTTNVKVMISNAGMAALASINSVAAPAIQTVRGAIVATPTSGGTGVYALRVPWLVTPRGLSNVTAGAHSAFSLSGGIESASIPLSNSGIRSGIADVYAWGISDANDGLQKSDIRSVGVQTFPSGGDAVVVFAMNTWGRWGNASTNEYDVAIDTNRDGTADYLVAGFDDGALFTGLYNGILDTVVVNLSAGVVAVYGAGAAPTNGSTVELGFLASDIGLSSGTSSFDYSTDIFNGFNGDLDFADGPGHFDALASAISTGDFITVAKGGHPSLAVSVDKASFNGGNSALGWMVVTLDDADGAAQADLVPVGTLP